MDRRLGTILRRAGVFAFANERPGFLEEFDLIPCNFFVKCATCVGWFDRDLTLRDDIPGIYTGIDVVDGNSGWRSSMMGQTLVCHPPF